MERSAKVRWTVPICVRQCLHPIQKTRRIYLARSDDFADVDGQREVSGPDSLHQEQVLLLCLFCQLLCLSSIDCESLLTQNILASLETEHSILVVMRVGSSDIDDVDILVSNQLLVRSVSLC